MGSLKLSFPIQELIRQTTHPPVLAMPLPRRVSNWLSGECAAWGRWGAFQPGAEAVAASALGGACSLSFVEHTQCTVFPAVHELVLPTFVPPAPHPSELQTGKHEPYVTSPLGGLLSPSNLIGSQTNSLHPPKSTCCLLFLSVAVTSSMWLWTPLHRHS